MSQLGQLFHKIAQTASSTTRDPPDRRASKDRRGPSDPSATSDPVRSCACVRRQACALVPQEHTALNGCPQSPADRGTRKTADPRHRTNPAMTQRQCFHRHVAATALLIQNRSHLPKAPIGGANLLSSNHLQTLHADTPSTESSTRVLFPNRVKYQLALYQGTALRAVGSGERPSSTRNHSWVIRRFLNRRW